MRSTPRLYIIPSSTRRLCTFRLHPTEYSTLIRLHRGILDSVKVRLVLLLIIM